MHELCLRWRRLTNHLLLLHKLLLLLLDLRVLLLRLSLLRIHRYEHQPCILHLLQRLLVLQLRMLHRLLHLRGELRLSWYSLASGSSLGDDVLRVMRQAFRQLSWTWVGLLLE